MGMAVGSAVSALKRSKMGEAYRASVLRHRADGVAEFFEPAPHRTYHWYLVMLGNGLDDRVHPRRPKLSNVRLDAARGSARQVIAAIRALFDDDALAPMVPLVCRALKETTPTGLAFERLTYYLIAELQLHLKSALQAGQGRRCSVQGVLSSARRTPRRRSELPDSHQPAWTTMNRTPPKKVQIPCRVDPRIKELIEEDRDAQGISQSRWLEEAIAEKLQRQGFAVELPKAAKAPVKKPRSPRRVQRPAIPEPEKSPDATVNRADKPTTVRVSKGLASQIDKARGKQNRSAWMNEAITAFLSEKAELPGPPDVLEELSEPVAMRFDKDFFSDVVAAANKSGVTRSEWYRSVARWYLNNNQ